MLQIVAILLGIKVPVPNSRGRPNLPVSASQKFTP